MKTIIVKSQGDNKKLTEFINRTVHYIDKLNNTTVTCLRYLDETNYNTIYGEVKDAVALNDFDIFVIGVMSKEMSELTSIISLNKAHTLVSDLDEIENVKNFIIMD